VVIAGHDRDYIATLIFPDIDACRRIAPDAIAGAPAAELMAGTAVRAVFEELLKGFARAGTGSSNRIACAILLDTPPSIDAHEITDKGSLNQGAVLRHRAALVEELYTGSARVIVAGGE
jgi:feruloyl-CoA synthase